MATRWQRVFLPNSGHWENQSLGESPLPHWQFEWNGPEEALKACVPFFFLPYPIPWTHPSSYNTTLRRVLSSTGGPTLRKDAGGGKPTTTRHGVHGAFQSSSSPESPPSFGCSRPGFTAGGPTWIWRLRARAEGSRHARPLGQPIGWHVLPSSASPMTVHPWEPSQASGAVTAAQVTVAWM